MNPRTKAERAPRCDVDDVATWASLAAEVQRETPAARGPAYWRLYRLAREVGRALQQRRFPGLDADDAAYAVDVFFQRGLAAALGASSVRAYAKACLHRELVSLVRRAERIRVDALDDARVGATSWDPLERLAHREAFDALDPRARRVLLGVALGYDREQLGRELGLSRAAVDQLVSRARARAR